MPWLMLGPHEAQRRRWRRSQLSRHEHKENKMRRPDLVAKNSQVAQSLQEGSPLIGVFWIHPETKELISPYAEPLDCGQHDPDLHVIDSTTLHINLWKIVKDQYPDLKHLKYDKVPRGRVFFNEMNKKFHVFGPASYLAETSIQDKIKSTYKLSEVK
jgi:hypothetical protein